MSENRCGSMTDVSVTVVENLHSIVIVVVAQRVKFTSIELV